MKHDHISKEDMHKYVTGCMRKKQAERIARHMESCERCRNACAEAEEFIRTLEGTVIPEPQHDILLKCRRKLFAAVKEEETRKFSLSAAAERAAEFLFRPVPAVKFAYVAAVFAAGIFFGRYMYSGPVISSPGAGSKAFTTIESIAFDTSRPGKSMVSLVLREDRTYTVDTSPTDPRLVDAAIYILKHEDRDDIRIKAMKILQHAKHTEDIERALISRLNSDENPGIRLMAIKMLKMFPINQKIRDTLIAAFFKDKNSGIRYEASDMLRNLPENPIETVNTNI